MMLYPTRYILAMTVAATAANAQVRLPALPLPTQSLSQTLGLPDSQNLDRLGDLRRVEINRLIRANRKVLDTDPHGEAVVRDEILALSPTQQATDRARSMGYVVNRERMIGTTNIHLVVLVGPSRMSTTKALHALREADPTGVYDFNHIYSSSGAISRGAGRPNDPQAPAASAAPAAGSRIGLLDTGVDATHPVFSGSVVHTWGCENHALPANHGTAVASLLIGRETELFAADVYCGKPTGGAADALVAAFGWMAQESVPVINVSLVGPKNVMMEHVIAALIDTGHVIVAAVGNDGPAAPPLYPASYPRVVGVTAVDAHHHVLIEAARGPQVMFASPGADLTVASVGHGYAQVRGTSFAAPIVAGLLASRLALPNVADATAAIDELAKTAIDLGPPGRDLTYGFGLVGADYQGPGSSVLR